LPTVRASRELLASPEDVWRYLSEPYHLSDWWPRVATVEPDRRGFAAGARWRVRSSEQQSGRAVTSAELSVSGPLLFGFSRSLPKDALDRLHDLCQTGVEI
jgi:uncharacterized protein YndB with AHSA1/START domain